MNKLCEVCSRVATHASPQLCDRCMARKNSTQWYKGKTITYAEFFLSTMPEGMGKQEDETRDEWKERCRLFIQGGGYAKSVVKSKGKKVATDHSDDDP